MLLSKGEPYGNQKGVFLLFKRRIIWKSNGVVRHVMRLAPCPDTKDTISLSEPVGISICQLISEFSHGSCQSANTISIQSPVTNMGKM